MLVVEIYLFPNFQFNIIYKNIQYNETSRNVQ